MRQLVVAPLRTTDEAAAQKPIVAVFAETLYSEAEGWRNLTAGCEGPGEFPNVCNYGSLWPSDKPFPELTFGAYIVDIRRASFSEGTDAVLVTLVHPEYDNPDHVELRTTELWRYAFGSD